MHRGGQLWMRSKPSGTGCEPAAGQRCGCARKAVCYEAHNTVYVWCVLNIHR